MRVLVSSFCSAILLAASPVTAWAQLAQPEPEQPEDVQPNAEQPDAEQPDDIVQIEPPASPEPLPTEPEPEPEPEQSEAELDEFVIPVTYREPTPEERARGQILRKTGIGLIAAGGGLAATGLGLTIAFTVVGDRRENRDQPVLADVERANTGATAGGILLASGIAIVAAGGIIFVRAKRQLGPQPIAQIRVTPALGGVVVSGRF